MTFICCQRKSPKTMHFRTFRTMKVWTLWLVLFVINNVGVNCSLSDATSSVFSGMHHSGIVAAFGDFNADKATDIFVLSENGKSSKQISKC